MIVTSSYILYGAQVVDGTNYMFCREKVVLHIEGDASVAYTYSAGGYVSAYTAGSDGVADIDVTDVVRTKIGETFSFWVRKGGASGNVIINDTFEVRNGICPSNWWLPQPQIECVKTISESIQVLSGGVAQTLTDVSGNIIGSTSTINLQNLNIGYTPLVVLQSGTPWYMPAYEPDFPYFGTDLWGQYEDRLQYLNEPSLVIKKQVVPSAEAVMLRWVNKLGDICRAWFKVRKRKYKTDGTREILVPNSGVYVQKGECKELEVYLNGLDDYSYAIYSDIVTSPKVETLGGYGGNLENFIGVWCPVNVTTKEVTMPDGNSGKLHELSFVVEAYKYDTI